MVARNKEKNNAERAAAVLKVFCKELLGLTAKKTTEYVETLLPELTPELLEKYCALIGHGYLHNIAPGPCCEQARKYNAHTVLPLNRLPQGQTARVVYVRASQHPALLRLYELGIYPGQPLRIQQLYPTYILATEQGNIAIDGELAKFIFVAKT
ncbi:putative ferrous iron regulator [Candidatus Termititenax persephonae]|uniref:Ferrous iron regulator n=1 Tax=Candidatus Termititenax persephonae TaxID=2218525 RepID=A0A388TI49_9BACT|nr:putative ferrous iron regulator [Candidatus Termititenax persephonae]